MASPPPKKSLKWPIILTIFGFVWVIPGLVAGFWTYKRWKYNQTTWVQLYNEWQTYYFCNQCGTSFSYAPANPTINVTPDPIAIDSMDGVDVIEPEKNQ